MTVTWRLTRASQAAVLFLWLAALVFLFAHGLKYGPTWDFMNVWSAAEAVRSGEPLYDPRPYWDRGYVYGPVVAVALRPLLFLGPNAAYVIWIFLSVACVAASVRLTGLALSRITGRPVPDWLLLIPFVILISPLASNFKYGNSNAFLMVLIATGFWGTVTSARPVGGAALALAAAIKVAPAIFLAWLLARRDWPGVAGFLGGALLWFGVIPAVVLGPERTAQETVLWGGQILAPVVGSASDPATSVRGPGHSLHWAIENLLGKSPPSTSNAPPDKQPSLDLLAPSTVRRLGQILALLILSVTLVLSWLKPGNGALSFGVMSGAMLLASPVSRSAHFVQLFPYLGLLSAWAFLDSWRIKRRARIVLLSALTVMIIAFLGATVTGHRSNVFFPLTGMALVLWSGGALLLAASSHAARQACSRDAAWSAPATPPHRPAS